MATGSQEAGSRNLGRAFLTRSFMPKDKDETRATREGKQRAADTAAEMFPGRLLISFPHSRWGESGTLLILLTHFVSSQLHLSLPPSQKLDGVLLPGDYFAFISCRLERTVEIFLRWRERKLATVSSLPFYFGRLSISNLDS